MKKISSRFRSLPAAYKALFASVGLSLGIGTGYFGAQLPGVATMFADVVKNIDVSSSEETSSVAEPEPATAQEVIKPDTSVQSEPQSELYSGPATQDETASSGCDENYSDCVPIADDVDCSDGSGDGPAYVDGPVKVIGIDIYGLDRDGDGYGCDS